MIDYNDFANQLRAKFPEYKKMGNYEFAQLMIQKYPVYAKQVSFPEEEKPKAAGHAAPNFAANNALYLASETEKKRLSEFQKNQDRIKAEEKAKLAAKAKADAAAKAREEAAEDRAFELVTGQPARPRGMEAIKSLITPGKPVNQYEEVKKMAANANKKENELLNSRYKEFDNFFNVDQSGVESFINKSIGNNQKFDIGLGMVSNDTKYRINNGIWERLIKGSDSYEIVTDRPGIAALNERYEQSVPLTDDRYLTKPKTIDPFLIVNSDFLAKTEESALDILRGKFGSMGFDFEQTGAGTDYIKVTPRNGADPMTFSFDEKSSDQAVRLQSFLRTNSSFENENALWSTVLQSFIADNRDLNKDPYGSNEYKNLFKNLTYLQKKEEVSRRQREASGFEFSDYGLAGWAAGLVYDTEENRKKLAENAKKMQDQLYNSEEWKLFNTEKSKFESLQSERYNKMLDKYKIARDNGDEEGERQAKLAIESGFSKNVIGDNLTNLTNSQYDLIKSNKNHSAKVKKLNEQISNGLIGEKEYNVAVELLTIEGKKLDIAAKNIVANQKTMEVLTGEYVFEKAKYGGVVSNMWNEFVVGVDGIISSANYIRGSGDIMKRAEIGRESRVITPEQKEYFKDKGYNEEEINNIRINKADLAARKANKKAVIESFGSDLTTEESKSNLGFVESALVGVAASLPSMLTRAIPGIGQVAAFASMANMSYNAMEEEMLSDPDFETYSKTDRAYVAVPYALVMGALENFGLNRLTKGQSYLLGKGVLGNIAKTLPKGATKEVLENIANKEIKSLIGKGVLKVVGGTLAEGETGAIQTFVADIGIKKAYNYLRATYTKEDLEKLTGGEAFATPQTFTEGAVAVGEGAVQEAIGGMAMSTLMVGSQRLITGNISLYNKEDLKFFDDFSADKEFKKLIVSRLKKDMLIGKTTKSEAQAILNDIDLVSGIFNSIDKNLSEESQMDAFNLISEKKRLEKEREGKDPALVAAQTDRINEINEELKNISKNATKETTDQQQAVTSEGGVSEYQGTSEGQPEVGQVEGGQREATVNETDIGNSTIPSKVQEEVSSEVETNVVQENNPRKPGYKNSIVKKEESTAKSGDKVTEYNSYAVDENGNEIKMSGGGVITTVGELAAVSENSGLFYSEDENGDRTILKLDPNTKIEINKTIEGNDSKGNYQQIITVTLVGNNKFDATNDSQGDFLTTKDIFSTPIYETNKTTTNEKVDQVATLRADEQAELLKAIPKIESYKVNGEIDKTLMPKTVLAKYNKIYNKYDKLISPLLETSSQEGTVKESDNTTQDIKITNSSGISSTYRAITSPSGTTDWEIKNMYGNWVKAESFKFKNIEEATRALEKEGSTLELIEAENTTTQAEDVTTSKKTEYKQNLVTPENAREVASRQDTPLKQKIAKTAAMIMRALPGVKIYFHNNEAEMHQALADSTGKSLDDVSKQIGDSRGSHVDGEIHINMENAKETTILHEAFHEAILRSGKSIKTIIDFANSLKNIISDKDVKAKLDKFVAMYGMEADDREEAIELENKKRIADGGVAMNEKESDNYIASLEEPTKSDEFLAELGAIMSEAETELTTTKLQKFLNLINRIARSLGLPVIIKSSATAQEAVDFINSMARSLRTGEEIEAGEYVDNPASVIKEEKQFGSDKTKITVKYTEEDKIDQLIKDELVKNIGNIKDLGEIYGATTSPDDMLVGAIYINNEIKAEGFGGIYFVTKFGDVWASSNKTTADQIVKRINQSVKDNKGKGYLFLTKGSDSKLISSPQGASSSLKIVESMVQDGLISASDFRSAINQSMKDNPATKSKINLSGNMSSSDMIKAVDSLFDDVKKSSFDNRGTILKSIIINIGNTESAKNNNDKIKEFLRVDKNNNLGWGKSSKTTKTTNSVLDLIANISREDVTRGLKNGDVYAVIEIDGEVEVKEDNHKSYPFHIKVKNGSKPKLILFKNREHGRDVLTSSDNKTYSDLGKSFDGVVLGTASNGYGYGKVLSNKKIRQQKAIKSEPVVGNKLFNEPLKEAGDIAKSYMKSIGKEYVPVEKITKLDEGLSKRISDAYDQMKNDPADPKAKAAYEAMAKETLDQYDAILSKGYKVELNNNDLYSSSEDMIKDLRDNRKMNVFPTESGFGDEAITDKQRKENVLLRDSGKKDANGKVLLVNDVFRFVHDFFGHAKLGNSFGPIGEENAWRVHSEMYSPEAKKAMTSETRGQNSFVNFSGVNDAVFKKRDKARELRKEGKIDQANQMVEEVYNEMKFADQKLGILPSFAIEEGSPSKIKQQKTSGVGYRSGDLTNKAETKGKFEGGNRSTGHFGTGFYFFGTKKKADEYSNRETSSIDLNGYNLANGTIELHNLLKDVNKYAIGTQKENDYLKYSIENIIKYFNKLNGLKDISDQNNKIKSIVDKINNSTIDSPSTIVMKSLGFDGVDSRGTDLDNAQYGSVIYSLKTAEEGTPSKIKLQKTPQETRMDKESEDVFKKSLDRGTTWPKATQNALDYIQKSKWYQDATDVEREQKVRDFKESKKQKLKKAPSVAKILGTPKPKMVTVNEAAAFKDQLRLEAKAAREAKADLNSKRKSLSDAIKGMVKLGKLKVSQASTIIKRISNINLDNPVMVERLIDYAAKVFDRADYQERLDRAFSYRRAIKRLLKSDNQAQVVGMANQFAKIDPSMVENIDDYIAMAEIVKNAVAPSRVKGLDVVLKEAANIEAVSNFSKDALEKQEQKLKDELLATNNDLLESGVISGDMTIKEIQEILNAIKDPEYKMDSQEKERYIRSYLSKRFESLASIVTDIINTNQNPLTGEQVAITEKDRAIISDLLNIDLSDMSIRDAIFAVEAMDNFINNGITSKLEGALSAYKGQLGLKQQIKSGKVARSLKLYFSKKIGRYFATEFTPLTLMIERMFSGVKSGISVMKSMGLDVIINGVNRANNLHNKIINEYYEKFIKNSKTFHNPENVYERGMLSFLKRNVTGSLEEMKAETSRRIKMIEESIITLMNDGDKSQKDMAEIYQKVFDKLGVSTGDIDVIDSRASKENRDAVDWWMKEWSKHYQDLADVSLSVYNYDLGSDINYSSPDVYKTIKTEGFDQSLSERNSSFLISIDHMTDKNKTGVLMQANRPKVMPDGRYLSFDFDANNSNSLKGALVDVNTAPGIRQVDGFLNSKLLSKLIPTSEDRDVLIQRTNRYIRRAKGKIFIPTDLYKDVDAVLNFAASLGVGKALGGVLQSVKQTIPIAISTALMTGRLNISDFEFNEWLNKTGMPISNRGIESLSTIESIDRRMAAKGTKFKDSLKWIQEKQQLYVKWFLSKPDVFIARSGFQSYYLQYIKESSIDWANHTPNQDALNYAQAMVDRQQNISDPMLGGEFLTSEEGMKRMAKKILFPFASFGLNQKARLYSDLINMLSKTTSTEDRKIALKSATATIAEMVAYRAISVGIGYGFYKAANAIVSGSIGGDDDDEDEENNLKWLLSATKFPIKSMINDLISPIQMADKYVTMGTDYLLSLGTGYTEAELNELVKQENEIRELKDQDPMDAKQKEKFKEEAKNKSLYQVGSKFDDNAGLGMVSIASDLYEKIYNDYILATTGGFQDEYKGNITIKKIRPIEQELIKNTLYFSGLFAIGLLPKESDQIVTKVVNMVKKNAMSESEYEKYEAFKKEYKREPVNFEMGMIRSDKKYEYISKEIEWVKREGGLNLAQGNEYIKLLNTIKEVTSSNLAEIKAGKTADQIVKSMKKSNNLVDNGIVVAPM